MREVIELTDFLKTGKFGPVELGDSIETVREKLGEPNDSHAGNVKSNTSLVYTRYEFFFSENQLYFIQNDHYDPKHPEYMEFSNELISIDPGFLKADRVKKFGETLDILRDLDIPHQTIDYWERKAIKTRGGVVIDFLEEEWSDKANDWVKIEDHLQRPLIGFRYSPKWDKMS